MRFDGMGLVLFFGAIVLLVLFSLGYAIKVETTCDGVVQENYWGFPSCVAAGGTK